MNKKDYGRPATDNNDFKPNSDYDSIRKNRNLDRDIANRDLDLDKTSGRIREKDFDYTANDTKWYDQWR